MSNLIIRTMTAEDIPSILNNYMEQGEQKPLDVLQYYLNAQDNGELYMFIAQYDNDVAGYVVLYPQTKFGAFGGKGIPKLADFIVFTKYRRKGIGNNILDAAEAKAAEISNSLSLSVGLHSGYGAAQRIYVKRGYVPDGSGLWYDNEPVGYGVQCPNDDDLEMFFLKEF